MGWYHTIGFDNDGNAPGDEGQEGASNDRGCGESKETADTSNANAKPSSHVVKNSEEAPPSGASTRSIPESVKSPTSEKAVSDSSDDSSGGGSSAAGGFASDNTNTPCPLPEGTTTPPAPPPNVRAIYHLCLKDLWQEAFEEGSPYFPPTFVKDGHFTRASVDQAAALAAGNEYYRSSTDKWLCVELDAQYLWKSLGIAVYADVTAPETRPHKRRVTCLTVHGGIGTTLPKLVTAVYEVHRDAKTGEFRTMSKMGVDWKRNAAERPEEQPEQFSVGREQMMAAAAAADAISEAAVAKAKEKKKKYKFMFWKSKQKQ